MWFLNLSGLLVIHTSLLIGGANGNFVFEFEVKISCEMKRKSVMPNGFNILRRKSSTVHRLDSKNLAGTL